MAVTRLDRVGDGSTTIYDVSFALGYLKREYVYVYLETAVYTDQLDYAWINNTQIELNSPLEVGVKFSIRRVVPRSTPVNDYEAGAILRESNLDDSLVQPLMILEEIEDGYISVDGEFLVTSDIDMQGNRVINSVPATDPAGLVTLQQLTDAIEQNTLTGAVNGSTPFHSVTSLEGWTRALVEKAGANLPLVPDTEINSVRLAAMNAVYDTFGTTAEIATGKFQVGKRVLVTDRGNGVFLIEVGTEMDGGETIYAGFGRIGKLQFDTYIHAAWVGAISNFAGVRETETTAALNLLFSYIVKYTGLNIELGGRYYTNDEVVVPLVTDKTVYTVGMQSINGNNSLIANSNSTPSVEGTALRLKTGESIGNRNYGVLVQDLLILNKGTYLTGYGLVTEGSYSPTFRRVYVGDYSISFDSYCSSEMLFDKCVAFNCNIGSRGNQTANPNDVDGNDFSVITYNQFVCFGFEQYGTYTTGGGVTRHEGGTIAQPGLAARSAIHYEGECRDVTIQDVIVETQQLLADGILSFTGEGLKRSIKISGVTQEVVNAAAPSTLIVATGVENITIENVPFNVAAASLANIKYAIIDGAKQVTLTNNARSYSYLNKIDLYDVETLVVDNYHIKGRNSDLAVRRIATGEPIAVDFAGTFVNTSVVDHVGKSAVTCSSVQTIITQEEFNNKINKKIPLLAVAKVKTAGTTITTQLRKGATNAGELVSGCKPNRWKTHLFSIPTDTQAPSTSFSNGVRFSNVSAASMVGVLSNDDTFTQELYALQADITGGILNWPKFTTIYNASSVPADPIGWINTLGGVKTITT